MPSTSVAVMTPADTLTLYHAGPDDAATYARVARDTFYHSYHALSDPATMVTHLHRSFSEGIQRDELEDAANTVLVARAGDRSWAGFMSLRTGVPPACVSTSPSLHLARLYAVREWHGRGAGPFLLDAAHDHARHAGCHGLWLQVWERNARARRFYEKHGFVEVGTHPYRFGDEWEDDLVLERRV